MKPQRLAGLAVVVALATISGARANTIVNGSFEDPVISYPWYENFGTGCLGNCAGGPPGPGGVTAALPGWTVTTNNVDVVSVVGGWPAPAYDGSQYLDLVGTGSTGGISQTFATTPGVKYNLSFAYGNNPESTSFAIATVKVTPGSSATLPAVFFANFSTENNIGWEVFTASFVADSLFTTLSFNEVFGENNGGVLLDAINVTATPLPSTWLMLLSGFVGLGFFAHRATKKRTVALAAA